MTTYRVNPYRNTAVPSRHELHLMNRLGCGYSRGAWAQMREAGGAGRWLDLQLSPGTVAESTKARALAGWFPDLDQSPARKWEIHHAGVKGNWDYARDFANYSMLRRMYSRRQVLETMVDFWSNHLHIQANNDLAWVHRYSYDRTIREHALGRFDELLVATSLHPAMLLYLDNWRSERGAPNENQGRELLELHTVGRTSGYTEAMVKDSAKILSGYTVDTVDTFGSWRGYYDPGRHTTGKVQVLGFTDDNASADGAALARRYLRYLAHHPATARTIATKLALRFVSDSPSDELVTHLASVFRGSGTDIKATLRALVAHDEFRRSFRKKVRTPVEDLVATVRVLKVDAREPGSDAAFAHVISWLHKSLILYQWPRPDGAPERNTAWASASRMLGSFKMHWNLAGGWYPSVDVAYRSHASWLPQRRIRFDEYVDHLCRTIHGTRSTSRLLKACCQAVGYPPGTVVTKDHAINVWLHARLVAVLLDSPEHMSR